MPGPAVLASPDELAGAVAYVLPVDLIIPGCPPTPDAIADALLRLIDGPARTSHPDR